MEVDDAVLANSPAGATAKDEDVIATVSSKDVAVPTPPPLPQSDINGRANSPVRRSGRRQHQKDEVAETVETAPEVSAVVAADGADELLKLGTPLKLQVSGSDEDHEDEDEDEDEPLADAYKRRKNIEKSLRRKLLKSPGSDPGDRSSGSGANKRKRYEIRRSGSEDCLLGFDEKSGEAELVKDASGELLNNSPDKSEYEETVQSPVESPRAIKKVKRSPSAAPSVKASPRSQASPAATPPRNKPAATATITPAAAAAANLQTQKTEEAVKHHIVGDIEDSVEPYVIATHPVGVSNTSAHAPGTPIPKKPLSVKDDYYKKPFEYGWKRELVYRANMETSKDKADVYFITPGGKKLRTRSDIAPLLEGDLTLDHFSFAREPLGVGPELELVRSAKPSHRASVAAATLAAAIPAPSHPGKRISKPKVPKGASPPPQGWTPTRALKTNNAALLSSAGSSKYSGGGSGNPTTPPSSRSLSLHGGGTNSNSSGSKGSKTKKHLNDIENDLKQINESIRNSRKQSSTSMDAVFQPNNVADIVQKSFATNFFANVSFAYDALLCILKYLKIHERPRAASVCKLWNLAAKDTSLWQTVRMKNSKISNWGGFAAALRRGETKHLDLRKMLLSNAKTDEMWQDFSSYIGTVYSLESIDLCRCSTKVVESLFVSNPNLRVLNAIAINDESFSLENIDKLQHLTELRLRTCEPGTLDGDLLSLQKLSKLTHLSLTSLLGLGTKSVEVLGDLVNLKSLELGECGDFDSNFAHAVLPKLANLQRLRLENGQKTSCCTLEILDAVAKLEKLSQLEFVNFDIKPGFDEKLTQCSNIRKLLIIPTYISQSATTNQIVLNAVQQIASTLKVFTWGVTVELLRVTALYVDQCEESTKKEKHHFDECIPVMKPVPGAPPSDSQEQEVEDLGPNAVPQIEILPLDKVESILGDNLSSTKYTIVKVPYQATCKQQLVE